MCIHVHGGIGLVGIKTSNAALLPPLVSRGAGGHAAQHARTHSPGAAHHCIPMRLHVHSVAADVSCNKTVRTPQHGGMEGMHAACGPASSGVSACVHVCMYAAGSHWRAGGRGACYHAATGYHVCAYSCQGSKHVCGDCYGSCSMCAIAAAPPGLHSVQTSQPAGHAPVRRAGPHGPPPHPRAALRAGARWLARWIG